jgi:hypothetical protein
MVFAVQMAVQPYHRLIEGAALSPPGPPGLKPLAQFVETL